MQRIDELTQSYEERAVDLLALDEALTKLARTHPELAQLVELRFFAGLTIDQVAKTLDISPATADRHWAYARAFLYHELQSRDD